MNKSLVLASLVAVVALAACGKKEEAAAPAAAPRRAAAARCCRGRLRPPSAAASAAAAAARPLRCASAAAAAAARPLPPPSRTLPLRPPSRNRPARPRRQARKPPSGGFFALLRRRAATSVRRPARATMRLLFSPASGAPCELSTDDDGLRAVALQRHLVLDRRRAGVAAAAEELARRSRAGVLAGGLRVDIAHEVQARRAVAVLDGEAGAVERDADAAPGAVEAVVDFERGARLVGRATRARSLAPARAATGLSTALRATVSVAPSLTSSRDSISASSCGSAGRGCPLGEVLLRTGVDLVHALVGDEDLAAGGRALDARAVLVHLAGGVRPSRAPTRGSCG